MSQGCSGRHWQIVTSRCLHRHFNGYEWVCLDAALQRLIRMQKRLMKLDKKGQRSVESH